MSYCHVLTACRQLIVAKHHEAVYLNICGGFQSIADFCVHLSGFIIHQIFFRAAIVLDSSRDRIYPS